MIQPESRNPVHHHRRLKGTVPELKTPVQDDPTSTAAVQIKHFVSIFGYPWMGARWYKVVYRQSRE